MIEALLKPEVQKFIRDHENDDPVALILKAKQFKNIPVQEALEQIKSRKKAKTKLPHWYASNQLIFPPPLSIEQSSSELAARYKASLFKGDNFVDLTGGMGIDFSFISKSFKNVIYVEKQTHLVELAEHNMACLGIEKGTFLNQEANELISNSTMSFDLMYLDPARRGANQQKVFRVADCDPNIIDLLPMLKPKAKCILIKMSPLLDIKGAISDIGGVTEVHVIAINNEVKELLFIINNETSLDPSIRAIDLEDSNVDLNFKYSEEEAICTDSHETNDFLYEPNVASLKAGGFKSIVSKLGLKKLLSNSHLYTSESLIKSFPGRSFRVIQELKMNKKEVKMALPNMQANITVRNYPISVDEIRKKTGLKDGGENYIFATTDKNGKKILLCKKVN